MFHFRTGHVVAIATLLSTASLSQTAYAASYADALPRGQKTVYTAALSDITKGDTSRSIHTLDWRQPSLQLFFDLPPSERTSEIILTLSADPLTRVDPSAPLQVQFNNDKPVPVLSNGRGFEARIPLDASKSRPNRNSLRITYPAPEGADCITPAHGEWSIDLSSSTLRMAGRARLGNMSLADLDERLSEPALAPKKVGLIASGPNSTDMQALAAQGISLRTPDIPKFSVSSKGTDFNIVMVTRDRLFGITDDPMILNSEGARIFVPKGRPTELIFTAETDAEILNMLELFAARELPNTRRAISSLGELNLQPRIGGDIVTIEQSARLSKLGAGQTSAGLGIDSWAAGSQSYRFGVADPVSTGGELLLRLSTTDEVADTSRLRVALNGEVLGAAKLDKKRKSVIFDIEPGKLNSTSNLLSILPELEAKPGYSCPSLTSGFPTFSIGQGSKLKLTQGRPSPVTELSRLTATGGVFSDTESYIVLPSGTRDFQASLRVLGQIAKSSGQGLILADYVRGENEFQDKHVLVIGPAKLAKPYLTEAPKALKDALKGHTGTGDNLLKADIERFASSGADDFAVRFAAAQTQPRSVSRGGVASLYGNNTGHLTGIISVASKDSFQSATNQLIQPAHWNALQGGVARWNKSSVLMTQIAKPAPGVKVPQRNQKIGLAEFDWGIFDFDDIEWPEFDLPQVSMPSFEWPQFTRPSFLKAEKETFEETSSITTVSAPVKSRDIYEPVKAAVSAPTFETPNKKMAQVMPRLKPVASSSVKPQVSSVTQGLRGKFNFDSPEKSKLGSFDDFRRITKSKWEATKNWIKAKKDSASDLRPYEDIAAATDRLQDQVKPAGKSIGQSIKDNMPRKGLIQLGDRTVSVYGLMLMLAFAIILLLMSFGGPKSRPSGRQ